jgi:photosystem II stability/assembly factor-like uncharacterized protein
MRPFSAVWTLAWGLLAALLLPPAARAGELRNFEDAALHAVQFVDANEGWAAGDDGVIWHTIDGGRNWERQPTGVRASLRSLCFVNPFTGWAAGREELPNGAGSVGVLLYTQDGGVAWRRVLLNALPGLNVVRFVDEKTGYVAGDGSDLHPSGLFTTTDGGRTWHPVTGPRCTSWLAADFGPEGGALAGAWNRLATLRGGQVRLADVDALGGRSLRGLQLRGKRGVAVGQGGLVLRSDGTAGSTWSYADLGLPPAVLAAWDFHAVGGAGDDVWVVGRPGSAVLHSPDGGTRWEVRLTGQPLPLSGVFFLDAQHGWAVGELGSVLATADGGKTWQVQRRGGQRAAVLCVHARAAGVAADTLARLGGDEGYLTACLRVTGSDPATADPGRCAEGPRAAAAARQAGGAAAETLWQFPVASHVAQGDRDELLKAWDRLHDDRAAEHLLRQAVLALRIWRPDVVLTDSPERGASPYPADALVAEAVREAFTRAADPQAFPEQITDLGLEPWKASKAYAQAGGTRPAQGTVVLDQTALSNRLEATYREFAAAPAALLAEGPVALPAQRAYRLFASRLPGGETHHGLMEGIDLPPGGLARRPAAPADELTPEAEKALRRRANLLAMAEQQAGALTEPERLVGQIGPMLADMGDDQGAKAAHALASQFARQGQWELAREVFLLLADRYPAHPLAADACRWLIRHNSSSEARRRHELGQFLVFGQTQFGLPREQGKADAAPAPAGDKKPQKPRPRPDGPAAEAHRTEEVGLLSGGEHVKQWYQSSLDLEPRLAGFGPLLVNDPGVQFCLQAARRNLGDFETAKQWYAKFASRQPDGPWRSAALAELWLMNRQGSPPKPVAACRQAETRPFLDGKLDDACWEGVKPLQLKAAAGDTLTDYPTEVRLAYDKDFLYVGLRCFHPVGRQVPPAAKRQHDSDLRGFDRVSLVLDLDRDYATCFHFQVDQRGCVAEDCWGDKTWDPRWFVAVHSEPAVWTVEAAIPLAALSGDVPTAGRAWAFNVVRAIPGAGVQAFSLPAEVPEECLRAEGMGLLMFTQEPRPVAPPGPGPVMSKAR